MTRAKDISKIITDADFSGTLEITKGASGASANAAADELVLQNSGDSGLSILSPNANNSQILLGSPVANAGGIIRWTGDDNAVKIGTNNTGSTLRFHVGGFSEVMRISSAGNVGIGTSSPSYPLTVASASNAVGIAINGRSSDNLGALYFFANNGSTQYGNILTSASEFRVTSTPASSVQTFYTNSSERMRIDNNGKVGIGTTPSTPLHVQASGQDTNVRIQSADNGYATRLQLYGNNVSGASFNAIQSYVNGDSTVQWEISGPKVSAEDQMLFSTGGSEAMRIDSSGNVGIGTSSPDTTTQISKSTTSTDGSVYPTLKIENTSAGTGNSYARFQLNGGNGTTGFTLLADGRSSNSDLSLRTTTSTPMSFYTNNSERMRIDSSGNVGIGTSSPFTSRNKGVTISGTSPTLYLEDTDSGSYTNCQLAFLGGEFSIYTGLRSGTGTSGSVHRFTIKTGGNVLVGTTNQSPAEGTTVGVRLGGNGTSQFSSAGDAGLCSNRTSDNGNAIVLRRDGAVVGTISVTTSSTSYNTSSDHRLKENVVAMTDATARLKQLQPKRFNFISDADTTVDGFLAHEVSSIVPEAVFGTHNEVDDDGNPVYQGIDQSKLVPLLVKTIQELEARIVALETA